MAQTPPKKIKVEDTVSGTNAASDSVFQQKGMFDNEITLKFDNGTEYYVSSDFLKMSSPVFSRLLEADFKEKRTKVIELKKKDPAVFMKFLRCLHPSIQEGITATTVFELLPLSEEYQTQPVIDQCQRVLGSILRTAKEDIDTGCYGNMFYPYGWDKGGQTSANSSFDGLLKAFQVLVLVNVYSYEALMTTAMQIISGYPSVMYLSETLKPAIHALYNKCSIQIKYSILRSRLGICDENNDPYSSRRQKKIKS